MEGIKMSKSVFKGIKKSSYFKTAQKLKLRVDECHVYSMPFCSVEALELNKKLEKKTESLEIWIYRTKGIVHG